MLPTPELVKKYIVDGLKSNGIDCTHVEVEGDGQHFQAVIVSSAFAGKMPLARQRLVYAALGERMNGSNAEIHALSMKTYTPEQFTQ